MSAPRGQVLYTAQFLRWMRILQVIGLGIAGLILLALVIAMAVLAVAAASESIAGALLLGGAALLIAVLGAGLLWSGARAVRLAMVVSTEGIAVRGYLCDRWIPWSEVSRIETGDHWYWRRATRIVTTDGRRVVATVTAHQHLFFRGERYDDAARDPRIPEVPTRVAIDAHRRYLAGELGR